jgi:hypothetical protein
MRSNLEITAMLLTPLMVKIAVDDAVDAKIAVDDDPGLCR